MSRPGSDAKQRHHALELSAMHGCMDGCMDARRCMGSGWDVSNACNAPGAKGKGRQRQAKAEAKAKARAGPVDRSASH